MEIKYIVVHCADTPNGRDNDAEDIHRWHKAKGWDGIGYHYVVTVDGGEQAGRPVYWPGAHVRGHNSESIGICLIGRDEFSEGQMTALENIVRGLVNKFPEAEVVGHRDLDSNKTCPNFDAKYWWMMQQ